MKAKLLLLTSSMILFAGCLPQTKSVKQLEQTPTTTPEVIETAKPSDNSTESANMNTKEIALSEIMKHKTPEDCWFAVDGSVYDVSPFIKLGIHPGGEQILKGCGLDASELFHTKAGKGKDHSDMAKNSISKYKIGTLKTE